jgi:hypothetical protein
VVPTERASNLECSADANRSSPNAQTLLASACSDDQTYGDVGASSRDAFTC